MRDDYFSTLIGLPPLYGPRGRLAICTNLILLEPPVMNLELRRGTMMLKGMVATGSMDRDAPEGHIGLMVHATLQGAAGGTDSLSTAPMPARKSMGPVDLRRIGVVRPKWVGQSKPQSSLWSVGRPLVP